jgi:hypothetical protein
MEVHWQSLSTAQQTSAVGNFRGGASAVCTGDETGWRPVELLIASIRIFPGHKDPAIQGVSSSAPSQNLEDKTVMMRPPLSYHNAHSSRSHGVFPDRPE